jgi:tRNA G10  N-methylase Trm11
MGEVLLYPRDVDRYKYFVRESNEHGAKLEIRTYQWLVERYTQPGDTILDPMSGVGTVHWAATMGRNTVAIELVDRFVELQGLNIRKLNETRGLNAKTTVYAGDCRMHLPLQADSVIFSPPYGTLFKGSASKGETGGWRDRKNIAIGYSDDVANIGNIGTYPVYLESMKEVYRLCNQSLPMGGYMILVTKDQVVHKQRVYVTVDNLRVAREVGFEIDDWHQRYTDPKILQIKTWERKDAAGDRNLETRIVTEDILVLKKKESV